NRTSRIDKQGERFGFWHQVVQQFQSFLRQYRGDNPNAGDVSPWPVEARDKAEFERVGASDKDDGNASCRGLGREHCRWPECADRCHLPLHQIGRHRRKWIIAVCYPAVFDRDVLTFDIAHLGKTAAECGIELHGNGLAEAAQIPDHRHRRLLRARLERPHRRAAEQRDELAAFHSITSSAVASSVGGRSRPSAFALLRLITSSNFVGCSTGISAGFSPFRILSTSSAARRYSCRRSAP